MSNLNRAASDLKLIFVALLAGLILAGASTYSPAVHAEPVVCTADNTVTADVVALDQSIMFNRLGAQNVNWMVYALERDVVTANYEDSSLNGVPLTDATITPLAGFVALRPDKRPRPLVLRVAAEGCLRVTLTNLLDPGNGTSQANPFNAVLDDNSNLNDNNCPGIDGDNDPTTGPRDPNCEQVMNINNQVEGRYVSFHPLGMQLVDDIDDDGSFVGKNNTGVTGSKGATTPGGSLLAPGHTGIYTYYAEAENAYMVYSRGQPFGGEASGGNVGVGLFAVVNVEPKGASFYRSQVSEEEMRLATKGYQTGYPQKTPHDYDGYWGEQPVIDYEATYPDKEPWVSEGKANLPILNMLDGNEIVHSDINAIITGTNTDGSFTPDTYPLENVGKRNPVLPNRLEAFREFTVVFHDETGATQAFPKWFEHPVLGHTLHGVRDSFMINYGSGGIGAEIVANRLRSGPMHDCLNCAYEEFFLTAYTVGDVAMLVDVPANAGLELCTPDDILNTCVPNIGPKAGEAFFPDDPSNVHHSYKRDFVKFRNLHAGPKEQHIFHLHNHQWLFNPNDDNSNYIDAQGIGPGSGYTYEINLGGSGNRNLSAGDAIFHCHFYPHFAQGMWEMWRIHDVLETGTELAVSTDDMYHGDDFDGDNIHDTAFALQSGRPAFGARALPDGEIVAGTPIPGLVPLPGVALLPMPGARVTVEPKYAPPPADNPSMPPAAVASVAKVHRETDTYGKLVDPDTGLPIGNPGYPFWIAGIEHTVGQRPTTPPLDMITEEYARTLRSSCLTDPTKPEDPDYNPIDEDCLWSHPGFVAGAGGWDGGLPRHTLEGYSQGGHSVNVQNRLDFTKVITKAKPMYFPEEGTDLEQLVMAFNAELFYDSYSLDMYGNTTTAQFQTNGRKPVPSAPFYEPCRDDQGDLFLGTGEFWGADLAGGYAPTSPYSPNHAAAPRVYMGANIQIDAVLNKAGYHFPQQRIIALWQDVMDTIDKTRAPEPLVMRSNTYDCVKYLHANLVPEYYELDDYQVRTPTDIIGQHIHLPKWDLVANDGSGNGWNYEDGTLSPGTVRERIHAINNYTLGDPYHPDGLHAKDHPFFGEFSTGKDGARPWLGARNTIQRWFTDPVLNTEEIDRGLGIIFTHDHYGPSTHQQVGLYATILAEPANSTWKHNETGADLYGRAIAFEGCEAPCTDGGPTSWQAVIDDGDDAFREFYFEFGDFQHAYEKGTYVGINDLGTLTVPKDEFTRSPVTAGTTLLSTPDMDIVLTPPVAPDGAGTFLTSINPSYRQEPETEADVFPDIVRYPPTCPGHGQLDANGNPFVAERPCAEAISADDVGMLVANYRNEPIGLRVYDPTKEGPDGNNGTQADGPAGDLAFALQSRTDRAINAFNTARGYGTAPDGEVINNTPNFDPLLDMNFGGIEAGDPYTPMMRAYSNDLVKIKIQAGSTEHEHNAIVHGVKWLQGGSSFGQAPNSGWRGAQNDGISEQFTFHAPLVLNANAEGPQRDYAYSLDASQDGWWTGVWGILRSYENTAEGLYPLPRQDIDPGQIVNQGDFDLVCPLDENGDILNRRDYTVVAVLANDVLDKPAGTTLVPPSSDLSATMHEGAKNEDGTNALDKDGGTLVYNPRQYETIPGAGLHDPTAMLYVLQQDLVARYPADPNCKDRPAKRKRPALPGVLNPQCDVKLDGPVEPLALRAAAGDCLKVTLYNRLPAVAPDLAGYNTLLQMVNRRVDDNGSLRTFQNNLIRPSSYVGLHPQMLAYDVVTSDGAIVGLNGWNGVDNAGNGNLPNDTSVVAPINANGDLADPVTYTWYAGHLELVPAAVETTTTTKKKKGKPGGGGGNNGGGNNPVELVATPVEFGGFNLNPADKIKQGQKGLVGAGVILPRHATWTNDPGSHAQATVQLNDEYGIPLEDEYENPLDFRDATLVFQKGLNHRLGDGSAVPNIASEGQGIPEDSHDAGQMAINYGSEPMWFRFGLAPDAPFENVPGGFGAVQDSHKAFSNSQVGGGDPVTPVITATAGQEVRIRVLEPTGAGRGTTFNLDGHAWQRDPYICPGSSHLGLPGKCVPNSEVGSRAIGDNPIGLVLGHQESVTPGAHFDIVPLNGAGGVNGIQGDFLYSDQGSFGPTSGLWGILRVE